MTPAVVLLALALAPGSPPAADAADVLATAERAFADGVNHRDDADAARPAFARSAAAYDDLWHRGHRSPALGRNRARAHRLAGNLPACLAALHDGLAVARADRSLQAELADARTAVEYPLVGDLAAQCRPAPAVGIGTRLSPTEAYLAAGLLWLLACLGAARFAMTRGRWWLLFAGAWLAGLAALGGLWWQDDARRSREESRPLVIVADDVFLRRGNGTSYPPRLEPKLPKGVEVRELSRRGGWVQVELAGGAAGWLPEGAIIRAGNTL